jgi:hypothetical protein
MRVTDHHKLHSYTETLSFNNLRTEVHLNNIKMNSVHISKKPHCISITKICRLMTFRKTIVVLRTELIYIVHKVSVRTGGIHVRFEVVTAVVMNSCLLR